MSASAWEARTPCLVLQSFLFLDDVNCRKSTVQDGLHSSEENFLKWGEYLNLDKSGSFVYTVSHSVYMLEYKDEFSHSKSHLSELFVQV